MSKYKNINEIITKANSIIDKITDEERKNNDIIIATCKRPDVQYHYMVRVPYSNKKLIRDSILESGNPMYAYLVARDFRQYAVNNGRYYNEYDIEYVDYDLTENEKIVLKSGNPMLCRLYAKNIPGADVEALGKVVMNSDDDEVKAAFMNDIKNRNASKSGKRLSLH